MFRVFNHQIIQILEYIEENDDLSCLIFALGKYSKYNIYLKKKIYIPIAKITSEFCMINILAKIFISGLSIAKISSPQKFL